MRKLIKMNKKTSSASKTKPESLFSIKYRSLHRPLVTRLMRIFQTWLVIVYYPREFFSRFFGQNCAHIKFNARIFLGLKKYNIDTEQYKLLNPLDFARWTGGISVGTLALVISIYSSSPSIADKLNFPDLPLVLTLYGVKELLISIYIVAWVILCGIFLAVYLYVFCKKGTSMKALIDYSVYTVTAWMVSIIVGYFVCALLLLPLINQFPENGNVHISLDDPSLILFAIIFVMYTAVLVYISLVITLRLFISNVIIVLREILQQKAWIIPFILGCPIILFVGMQFGGDFLFWALGHF